MTVEFSLEEYLTLEEAYINMNAVANLLEAWVEREYSVEVSMLLEKVKPQLSTCKKIFERH